MSVNRGGSTGSFLVGAAIGASIALLLAPMAGGETRRQIGGAARKLKEGASEAVDNVKGLVKEGASGVNAALDAGRDAMRRGEKAVNASDRG